MRIRAVMAGPKTMILEGEVAYQAGRGTITSERGAALVTELRKDPQGIAGARFELEFGDVKLWDCRIETPVPGSVVRFIFLSEGVPGEPQPGHEDQF